MSRKLLLLRHGKSDWSSGDDDFDRPLKKRGINAAIKIGNWLLENKFKPDLIITSPASRALNTAEIIGKTIGIKKNYIYKDKHLYLASTDALLYALDNCPEQASCVMLVGHNPGLEELLYFLSGGQLDIPEDGKILPTATLAVLQMPDKWNELTSGSATVDALIRPRELPDISSEQ